MKVSFRSNLLRNNYYLWSSWLIVPAAIMLLFVLFLFPNVAKADVFVPWISQFPDPYESNMYCGPTCCVMVDYGIKGIGPFDNDDLHTLAYTKIKLVVDWAIKNGADNLEAKGADKEELVTILKQGMGYNNAAWYSLCSTTTITKYLDNGIAVILPVTSYGGHFIVAYNYDDDYLYVRDSAQQWENESKSIQRIAWSEFNNLWQTAKSIVVADSFISFTENTDGSGWKYNIHLNEASSAQYASEMGFPNDQLSRIEIPNKNVVVEIYENDNYEGRCLACRGPATYRLEEFERDGMNMNDQCSSYKIIILPDDGVYPIESGGCGIIYPEEYSVTSLQSPADGSQYSAGTSITFAWADTGASTYKLEIICDSDSSRTKIMDVTGTSQSVTFSDADVGDWRWQVRSYNGSEVGDAPHTYSFTINTPPPDVSRNIHATYYEGVDLSVLRYETDISSINFDCGTGMPSGVSFYSDAFSARFSYTSNSYTEGFYKFHYEVDDAIKIWIDEECKVDQWSSHVLNEYSSPIFIRGGTHSMWIDYADMGGEAKLKVEYAACAEPTISLYSPANNATFTTNDSISFSWSGLNLPAGSRYILQLINADTGAIVNEGIIYWNRDRLVNWTLPVGNYKWQVFMRSFAGTTTEYCNSEYGTFTVTSPSPTQPDLKPAAIRYEIQDGTYYFNASIQSFNQVSSGSFKVQWLVNNEVQAETVISGMSGNTTLVNYDSGFAWAPASSGNYTITFKVDCDQQIEEADETNNNTSAIITATVNKPDLIPTEITYDENDLYVGNTFTLDTGIQNATGVDTSGFNIAWYINSERVGYGYHDGVSGNSTVYNGNSQYIWTPTAAGWYTVTFAVDSDNFIDEVNENNNSITYNLYIAPEAPDGTPTIVSCTSVPSSIDAPASAVLSVQISDSKNDVKYVFSSLYMGDSIYDVNLSIPIDFQYNLATGLWETTVEFSQYARAGMYSVWIDAYDDEGGEDHQAFDSVITVYNDQSDDQPPEWNSFSMDKSTMQLSDTVNIKAKATDNLSGVASVTGLFWVPSGICGLVVAMEYNTSSGYWEGAFSPQEWIDWGVDEGIVPGEYPVSLEVTDKVGNTKTEATSQTLTITQTTSTTEDIAGNTAGNITNGGMAAQSGNWIYYQNTSDNRYLYKLNTQTDEEIQLNNDNTLYINIIDNLIVYSNYSDNQKIYRINTDGTGRAKICDDKADTVTLVGDWIYYRNHSDGGSLYKIKADGTSRTKLNSQNSYCINVVGDTIYYSHDGGSFYIKSIKTDGSDLTTLNDDYSYDLNVVDGWIYYTNYKDGATFYKIRTDGTDRTKIDTDKGFNKNVSDGWLYYINWSDGKHLYKMKLDGSEKTQLTNSESSSPIVLDEWIYYYDAYSGDSRNLCRIPKDETSSGDANNDGTVDIMDLVNIIDFIVNGTVPASMTGADANEDGTVDISDLVWIIDQIVNGSVASAMQVDAAPLDASSREVEIEVPFSSSVPITALEVSYTLSQGLTFVSAECSNMTGTGGSTNAVFVNLSGGVTSGTVTLRVRINEGVTEKQFVNVTAVTGANTVGTRSVGIAQAYNVSVAASPALTILNQPVNTTVVVGVQGVFTVEASGAEPLTYQWYIDRNDGSGWVRTANGVQAQYITSQVTLQDDDYQYYCKVTDANGDTVDSEIVTLTVVTLPQTSDRSHPEWMIAMVVLATGGLIFIILRRRYSV